MNTLRGNAESDRHGWIATETVKTRVGNFEFKNGYPTPSAAGALLDQLTFNRAIEVYLTQIPAVAVIETRRGIRDFGAERSNQVVVWETLMDAETLVLTANTETVYGMGFLDLKGDGPTVIEAPPKMLGAAMDTLQRFLTDVGPLGPDKGKGASTYSSHRNTKARLRQRAKVTSSSSRRLSASATSCAASRWTGRRTKPWRS